ncbi:MAG: YlbF family regulator [Syntrophomonas sp.]|uniref:YlbF family regulator n=1 Tax=Syntrophomonas sp. TaxID=2053627 RepID=UPI00260AF0F1|nr:YlbF family regulator [Syntrophomonas sp.]MDD2510364.1 YlbF family regulator [Syntrophomonas sp.]MDD3879024.1 YlbF family regulator [Syntrophomonas sp.]MDD4626581.1 YlbF family regulator [Syntrophomonas sp.]
MTSEEIIKMAFELGNAVAQSEEIEGLKASQARVTQDHIAYDLIMSYQDAKSKMENKLQDGLSIGQAEQANLKNLEQELKSNSIINELMAAQEKFDNLMQAVYFAMNQALSGGCSSGCDSCGGSCNM